MDPYQKYIKDLSEKHGIPIPVASVAKHTIDVMGSVSIFDDMKDSRKRHAWRCMLNCIDVLFDTAHNRIIDEVKRANSNMSLYHLSDKNLTPNQRTSLEKSLIDE